METKMNNKKEKPAALKAFFIIDNEDNQYIEIGIDEAGRGPMFGRVYTAAVILPKDDTLFNHSLMKDSKKFHSIKKIKEAAEYIKKNAIAWHVSYACEKTIDDLNIRNATHKAMHEAAKAVIQTQAINKEKELNFHLLVDGCDFTPLTLTEEEEDKLINISHTCIEGGDNLYSAIAAASILAKTERDKYIEEMCLADPSLVTKYDLLKNKGYGTKKHMDGIKEHGISPFHRRTFGICKMFA
jgi:ribonuclease HII